MLATQRPAAIYHAYSERTIYNIKICKNDVGMGLQRQQLLTTIGKIWELGNGPWTEKIVFVEATMHILFFENMYKGHGL